jgi:hypothetical protein
MLFGAQVVQACIVRSWAPSPPTGEGWGGGEAAWGA